MVLNDLPLFALMSRKMDWLMQRETVLAQNIANADSPEFRPRDLTRQSFRQLVEGTHPTVKLAATGPGHIGPRTSQRAFRNEKSREVYETALDGNAVSIEEQLLKVAETQGAYRLATNLLQKHVSMLKQAIGRER
jgi:flagellar basal-body rod protein FlgB